MLLFTNKYFSINFFEVQQITSFHFSNEAQNLNSIFLEAELIWASDNMIKRFANLFFVDVSNIQHIIENNFFVWFEKNIISLNSLNSQTKIAWITPQKENFQISQNSTNFIHKFFDNHNLATHWLVENVKYEFGKKNKHH